MKPKNGYKTAVQWVSHPFFGTLLDENKYKSEDMNFNAKEGYIMSVVYQDKKNMACRSCTDGRGAGQGMG